MRRISRAVLALGGAVLASSALAAPPPDLEKIQVGGDGPIFPESITSTSDGTLYAGSLGTGVIYKAAPGAGKAEAWSDKAASGPTNILGVLADPARDTLWACYSDLGLFRGGQGQPAMLRAIDLNSGAIKQSYPMPGKSLCNDIAIGKGGAVFASDTNEGRIDRLAEPGGEVEQWFADERLKGIDGLTFGADGALYLTNVSSNKLLKLTLAPDGSPGELTEIATTHPLKGPDGLRTGPKGHLFLAENAAGQVNEITITGDKATLDPVESGFRGPTAVTVVGDTLYVSEAQIGQRGNKNPGPFYVYAVPLSGR